ncbi:MAG: Rrf2 family transcriptional regulator, partial [Coriobacteriales bacterium]|nr:Rrf2 family transcriptional regulator [Coriobacteriales bacterium]
MISTKGRYALRVLVDLAEQGSAAPVPLKDIARRQGISDKYLQHIAKLLVDRGLLVG